MKLAKLFVVGLVLAAVVAYFTDWEDWDSREKCVAQIDSTGGMGDACDELTPEQRASAQTLFDWGWANYSEEDRPAWIH